MSVISDHRSSPIFNRKENQSLSSADIIRSNRISVIENITESTIDMTDQTGTYMFIIICKKIDMYKIEHLL